MYPDQILGLLEIKDPSPSDNKIPDNYTVQQYIEDIYNVRSEIQRVLDRIENEIFNNAAKKILPPFCHRWLRFSQVFWNDLKIEEII